VENQSFDSLNQNLVLQEAKRLNINISQTEIDAKVDEVTSQIEAQGSDLESFLNSQGLSRQEFEQQVKIQLIIDEIIGKKIEISEEEIANYFEENKDYFEAGTTLEDVRDQLESELKQEKLVNQFQAWIEELKAKTTIYNFL
jgi:foldase protein PrsA